jgi:HD-like signal output (HDOD) protein
MTSANITSILNQIDDFPRLPATVTRVMAITADPESSANDLMQAILPDQSMCAAILKTANSAFYGRPRTVASIEEAIVVLGFQEIRNIILTQALFNSFQKFRHTSKTGIDALWQHSLTCGLTARVITTHTAHIRHSPSQLYIAGLIHDIGKVLMLIALPNSYNQVLELAERLRYSFFPDEEEAFGISHDTVGMRLLNLWLFPEQLCFAAGYHHRPDQAPPGATFPLIIQMADILSHILLTGEELDGQEILQLMHDFTPEIILLWEQYDFRWQAGDIDIWLAELKTRLDDNTLFDLFNN